MGGKKQKQKTEFGRSSDPGTRPSTGLDFQKELKADLNPLFSAKLAQASLQPNIRSLGIFFSLFGKYKKTTPEIYLLVFI